MRRFVEQIGKDSIAGDYHNPFGMRVDPLFVLHEAELGEDAAEAKVTRTQLPREVFSEKEFERFELRRSEGTATQAGRQDQPGAHRPVGAQQARRDILEIIVTLCRGSRIPGAPAARRREGGGAANSDSPSSSG